MCQFFKEHFILSHWQTNIKYERSCNQMNILSNHDLIFKIYVIFNIGRGDAHSADVPLSLTVSLKYTHLHSVILWLKYLHTGYYWNKFKAEQDKQCAYNVTMRRVLVTTVAVKKQWELHNLSVCVCVCSFRYPARNTHAPYCHLCPAHL
jgi:hypothetical protein